MMVKEIEINGCVEIPADMEADDFINEFIRWIEEHEWSFGGGFREIVDGYYILTDGSRGKHVNDEE